MEDIFHWIRKGDAIQVRLWLDDTEHDMNQGDDHQFSPLHWAAKGGHSKIVDMLIQRGARVHTTNMGDDTPLHLAAAHGHQDIVHTLLNHKADLNFINEHGNTPLHYACFWNYESVALDLVKAGSLVAIQNKYGESPLDKCQGSLGHRLYELAKERGQDLNRREFKDQSWIGLKTRSRDATLSRHKGININELYLHTKIATSQTGETWRGKWQGNEIAAKILNVRECTPRISRDFNEEYPKLRIFSHPNVMPVIGCCNSPPNLVVISQFMPVGSLYQVLHEEGGIVVDSNRALHFAIDIAKGMAFLHSIDRQTPRFHLNSKHVMIDCIADEEFCARVNMADARFTFQERGKSYHPQWMAPEALLKDPKGINTRAADMWSFAILLWELMSRELPFPELNPMEAGMRIAMEGLRIEISPGISLHMNKLIRICMNEDPGKRPSFEQVIPILEKMKK
ncbi:integrin-linked protein kinase homolog pat-4-like [Tigriopus californicus]|uniref:integrin-linked protein kinase homolog pat-4-like n=1 Tax=Tigriopus californicus TaxID=6832 RepID=UPI0027DA163C|nr:integrin-linked protein kinase homolog pat-4-like [Tigriopus californicus]